MTQKTKTVSTAVALAGKIIDTQIQKDKERCEQIIVELNRLLVDNDDDFYDGWNSGLLHAIRIVMKHYEA
jgi:hypothetical protein